MCFVSYPFSKIGKSRILDWFPIINHKDFVFFRVVGFSPAYIKHKASEP